MPLNRENAIAALRRVHDPEIHKDVVTLNMVRDIAIDGGAATVSIELRSPAAREAIERDVTAALRQAGAEMVRVIFSTTAGTTASGAPAGKPASALPQVKNVIAVGAGKGGVGKSTLALNLAIGLQRTGATVGLMDGDIYGPSMPTMLGIRGVTPEVVGGNIIPHHVHGIHAITIGSLVQQDQPLIWRGPKAHGAFKQLLLDNTTWPALDYLVVDLPPGTGDVPLTLGQLLPLTGAVVVATPQQVALDDAIRAVKMFQQLGAPILGLVENMSYFVGPDGSEHDIFGRGGTRRAAEQLGLPFLGELPMFTELRVNSDTGRPHANFEGTPKLSQSLETIVQNLIHQVDARNQQTGPTLEII
jgi:ATP-binding protein involved in chromosome partitioning